jgi:hypothetical protein
MRVSLRGREELAGRVQQVETAEMSQTGCGASGRREDGLPLPGLRPLQLLLRRFAKGHCFNAHPSDHSFHETSRGLPPRWMPMRTPSWSHLKRPA